MSPERAAETARIKLTRYLCQPASRLPPSFLGLSYFIYSYPGLLSCRPLSRAQSTVRLRLKNDINIFLTPFGRVKSELKPAVKNRATHGSEDCTACRVKTKADALGIGGQTPIWRAEPAELTILQVSAWALAKNGFHKLRSTHRRCLTFAQASGIMLRSYGRDEQFCIFRQR